MSEDLKTNVNNHDVIDSIKARDIVQEIMNFGVNDFQIRKIIKFLSLELLDRETMLKICSIIEEEVEQESKIEI